MSLNINNTAQHWSEYTANFSYRYVGLSWWEAGPEIQKHINNKISGSSNIDWVVWTLDRYYANKLPMTKSLSLGCGNGHLERRLANLGAFQHCDAYDVADGSIQAARKLTECEGLDNISYFVTDINKIELPASHYDVVWINHAMHHFEALEHICQEISRSLKPGGLLILNEYIGPSRFQFPGRQKEIANLCLQLIPEKYRIIVPEQTRLDFERTSLKKGKRWFFSRLFDKIRDGDLIGVIHRRLRAFIARVSGRKIEKTSVIFPSERDVIGIDPSEAIRSDEIIDVLIQYFDLVEKVDWGGNVLQFLLAGIAGNFTAEDHQSQMILKMLINIEDTLLQCSQFESDFAYIVARPKQRVVEK
jgi:SAM-dependent methyltransferase